MGTIYNEEITTIDLAVGAVSAVSTEFPADALSIDLYSDVLCHVQVGAAPTATTAAPSKPIPPFMWHPAFFLDVDGATEGNKIAAIRATTDGTLTIRVTAGPRP